MTYVGLDVSKAKLDSAVKTADKPRCTTVDNTEKGFAKLAQWLGKYPKPEVPICLEATSTYGVDCAVYLSQQGFKVSVVNPSWVKAFAGSRHLAKLPEVGFYKECQQNKGAICGSKS
jgi:transposase